MVEGFEVGVLSFGHETPRRAISLVFVEKLGSGFRGWVLGFDGQGSRLRVEELDCHASYMGKGS
jgi:hypothetical protein